MNIWFFTDSTYPGQMANKIAKLNLAIGFSALADVNQVFFYFFTGKRGFKIKYPKLVGKKIFIPYYSDEADGFLSKTYGKTLGNILVVFYLAMSYLLCAFNEDDLIYVRGEKSMLATYLLSFLRPRKFCVEIHNFTYKNNRLRDLFYRLVMNKAHLIVTVSNFTRENWIRSGISSKKILVFPSCVSSDFLKRSHSNPLVSHMQKNKNKYIVMYSGQLHKWKGIETFLLAAKFVPNTVFFVLGGSSKDILYYSNWIQNQEIENIIFLGNVEHRLVPSYIQHANILVLTNDPANANSTLHTSPLKLLEYMSAKKPIIAPDLPSIKQFFDETYLTFYSPKDHHHLANVIKDVIHRPSSTRTKTIKAYNYSRRTTWEKRALRIIKGFYDD